MLRRELNIEVTGNTAIVRGYRTFEGRASNGRTIHDGGLQVWVLSALVAEGDTKDFDRKKKKKTSITSRGYLSVLKRNSVHWVRNFNGF